MNIRETIASELAGQVVQEMDGMYDERTDEYSVEGWNLFALIRTQCEIAYDAAEQGWNSILEDEDADKNAPWPHGTGSRDPNVGA